MLHASRSGVEPTARHASRHLRPGQALLPLLVVLAVLATGTGPLAGAAYLKLNANLRGERVEDRLGERPAVEAGPRALNVLLIGSDSRAGANAAYGRDDGARADVTILLHLSADRSRAVGVSIPRDSMVQVPVCVGLDGTPLPGDLAMFNSAYERGGSACTIRTVESLTGIRVDHHVVVDFEGFKTMVEALGTVPVCLPRAVQDERAGLQLAAGRQEVGGEQALAYVRARYFDGGSDLQRIERQQRFLAAMVQKATSAGVLANPARLFSFLDAATKSITADPKLANLNELRKLAASVRDIGLDRVEFVTVPWEPYPANRNRLQWSPEAAQVWAALRADRPLPGRPADPPVTAQPLTVAPGAVSLRVLNGTGRAGVGASAAAQLRSIGFAVPYVAGADRPDYPGSVVRHDPTAEGAARTVAAAVPGARTEAVPGLGRVELIVGADYAGAQAVRLPGRPGRAGAASAASPAPAAAPAPSTAPSIEGRTAQQDVCS